jgi:hypothetical protein
MPKEPQVQNRHLGHPCRDAVQLAACKAGYTRSKIPAAPMPPPMHIVTMP